MKSVILSTLFIVSLLLIIFIIPAYAAEKNDKIIYFFYGQGCPHCEKVEEYFEKKDFYTSYPIEKKEIYNNRENALLMVEMLNKLGYSTEHIGVPTVIIGDTVLVGDKPIIDNFQLTAEKYLGSEKPVNEIPKTKPESLKNLTFISVVGASLVDAINPCAFAVLIILMTTVLASKSSKKALYSGLSFTLSIFISYFLMGLGIYKALSYGNAGNTIFSLVALLAIILGLLNIKDYFWYGRGILIEVPLSWRPHLKKLISSVTSPTGAFIVGFLVSLFLLPCTSGPYIVILGLLANSATQIKAIPYLILYNLIFVSPMVAITLLVYRGVSPANLESIRQRNLRLLHLIAGLILLILGLALIFFN